MAVYSIPPAHPFLSTLVRGLCERLRDAHVILLLPTRRACRELLNVFSHRAKSLGTLIVPTVCALDEMEPSLFPGMPPCPCPPAISSLKRHILLTRLVMAQGSTPVEHAAYLAESLASFLDELHIHHVDLTVLDELAPAHAEHWQETLSFLHLLRDAWPHILKEEGCVDHGERRHRLFAHVAKHLPEHKEYEVMVAGSTGSLPATAHVLQKVSSCGTVVLPGLDRCMSAGEWRRVLDQPQHPQYNMARLLRFLHCPREQVRLWCECPLSPREPVLTYVHLGTRPSTSLSKDVKGLEMMDFPTVHHEARTLALRMRHALGQDKSVALVTLDRVLEQHVASALLRWGIRMDMSAGVSLDSTLEGTFFLLVAEASLSPLSAVSLLALLKHPFCSLYEVSAVRSLELRCLRGYVGTVSLQKMKETVADDEELHALVSHLLVTFEPFQKVMLSSHSLSLFLTHHIKLAQSLCPTLPLYEDRTAGEASSAFNTFLSIVFENTSVFPQMSPRGYVSFLKALLRTQSVHEREGVHSHLNALGALEARVHEADVTFVAGLNEGIWPRSLHHGPWLSPLMRQHLGLPPMDHTIGLSAHDFNQCLYGDVVLSRSQKSQGRPQVPSRWLLRLQALLKDLASSTVWPLWASQLDATPQVLPSLPPCPSPPPHERPTSLSVTTLGWLLTDPYSAYAKTILNLVPLEPLQDAVSSALYGITVHRILDAFCQTYPQDLPSHPEASLIALGHTMMKPLMDDPFIRFFWWPRFQRLAEWFIEQERQRRHQGLRITTETQGYLRVPTAHGSYVVRARADRLEFLPDGECMVVDYKTGVPPLRSHIKEGKAPQLPLEALIAQNGGFEGQNAPTEVKDILVCKLSGGHPPGVFYSYGGGELQTLCRETYKGVQALMEHFSHAPYVASPRSLPLSPYNHLARRQEWSGVL